MKKFKVKMRKRSQQTYIMRVRGLQSTPQTLPQNDAIFRSNMSTCAVNSHCIFETSCLQSKPSKTTSLKMLQNFWPF